MSPSNSHISSQLRQMVYYHLDNNLVRNALFIAGRLHAFEPRSAENSYLVALCHLHNGQVKAAYDYTKNYGSRGTHAGCSYVYAQACLDLGKYLEGITALERSKHLWASKNNWNKHSETRRQHLPDAAAVLCLQAKLWHAHKDLSKAVECYIESLRLNPFMWDAFLGLCETGVTIRVPNIYRTTPELLATMSVAVQADEVHVDKAPAAPVPLQPQSHSDPNMDPFTLGTTRTEQTNTFGSSALWEKLNGSAVSVASVSAPLVHEGLETPGAQSGEPEEMRAAHGTGGAEAVFEPPLAPARRNRTLQTAGPDFTMDPPPKMRNASMKARTRTKADTDELSTGQTAKEAQPPPPRAVDRKRTVSGQVAHPPIPAPPTEPGAPQRRSVRLFNQIKPTTSKLSNTALGVKEGREMKKVRATGTKGRSATSSTVGRVVSGNRKQMSEGADADSKEHRSISTTGPSVSVGHAPSTGKTVEKSKEVEALAWLLELFTKLASGYYLLSCFKCPEAVQAFNSLSQGQRETPWVLAQLGRSFYEQAMYREAEKYFFRLRSLDSSRLEDMEIYSTVLWHLKQDVDLASLAHDLLAVDRLSPQAWCAVGNSFSHQRDHDQALKCFKRATQLNPRFAYAYTLQGHEYVSNEEYDKALDAYRSAINADNRHYNAWYGLGTVYDKMGKLSFAEQHFRNAAMINPTNAVLICCIGLTLEKMGDPRVALTYYGLACSLAPHSVLARFRKARALMKMHELIPALGELKILKDMAPDEANVHYLLGKLYKMLHDKGNAIKHFTTALNLDPKAAQYIKDAMEAMEDEDVSEDEDEDMT